MKVLLVAIMSMLFVSSAFAECKSKECEECEKRTDATTKYEYNEKAATKCIGKTIGNVGEVATDCPGINGKAVKEQTTGSTGADKTPAAREK